MILLQNMVEVLLILKIILNKWYHSFVSLSKYNLNLIETINTDYKSYKSYHQELRKASFK